jgi:chorismate mutase-like protein
MSGLEEFRRQIDEIDERIVALLGNRFAVIREVAAYKSARGISAVLPERVEEAKNLCARRAPDCGLDASFVRRLYTLIIDEACQLEERLMTAAQGEAKP